MWVRWGVVGSRVVNGHAGRGVWVRDQDWGVGDKMGKEGVGNRMSDVGGALEVLAVRVGCQVGW